MITFKISISGKVQGVGFREFARKNASIYGVKGYVKNMTGGDVEIIAQGNDLNISKFTKEMKRGPLLAHIKNVVVDKISEDVKYEGFIIEL